MCQLQAFSQNCTHLVKKVHLNVYGFFFFFLGLIMRKVALQKIHQASKQADQADDRYELFHSHIMMKAPDRSLPNMGKRQLSVGSNLHETAHNRV